MTLWAFDIECQDWDRFVLGAAVADDGRVVTFDTIEDVADWYRSTEKHDLVIAHFGGRYDMLFLIDAVAAPWVGTIAGSSVISVRVKGCAEVRDSFRLFPMSLAVWTGEKSETGLPCVCDGPKKCGGYCSIHVKMPPKLRSALMDYCVQDCRALVHAYQRDIAWGRGLLDLENQHGVPRRTIGSVAWATARRLCELEDRALPESIYEYGRQGYYGGRAEVFCPRSEGGYRYDINSAYPWALTLDFPDGTPREVGARGAMAAFVRQKQGIYLADVYVPRGPLPSLPMRNGDVGIAWSTGALRGAWTHEELSAALASGATLRELTGALVWPRSRPIYRPFVEAIYAEREKAMIGGDTSRATWLKWIMNSLSGKLAQGDEVETLHANDPDIPTDRGDRVRILNERAWISVHRKVPPCARPHHAAVITARTRLTLLDRLQRALGRGAPLYCDTDSCYSTDPDDQHVHETHLGHWKYEGEMSEWRAIAPKVYRFRNEKGIKVRAKGIPSADSADFDSLDAGGSVRYDRGVKGIKSALASDGKAFTRGKVERKIARSRKLAGLRRIVDPEMLTLPLHRSDDGEYFWPETGDAPVDYGIRLG